MILINPIDGINKPITCEKIPFITPPPKKKRKLQRQNH